MSSFSQRVISVVRAIPLGTTLSYKEVAKKAGSERAYRAVGSILKKNYDITIPCHRVICSNGKLGAYNRGKDRKKLLLQQEAGLISFGGAREDS